MSSHHTQNGNVVNIASEKRLTKLPPELNVGQVQKYSDLKMDYNDKLIKKIPSQFIKWTKIGGWQLWYYSDFGQLIWLIN